MRLDPFATLVGLRLFASSRALADHRPPPRCLHAPRSAAVISPLLDTSVVRSLSLAAAFSRERSFDEVTTVSG